MDSSPPGSPVLEILQARILEWVAISFSRRSSQPRSPPLQADSLLSEPPGKLKYHISHKRIGICLAKAIVPPSPPLPRTGVTFWEIWDHCSSLRLIGYLFSPKQIVLDRKGTDKSCHHPTLYAALFDFTLKVGQSVITVGDVGCPDISLVLLPALLVTCFSISSLFFSFHYFSPVVFFAS